MKARFLSCCSLLMLMMLLSVMSGARFYPLAQVAEALFHTDPARVADTIIRTSRLPRTCLAMGVGAFLAVAGGLMQALTRNPVASPGLFGVNAGAALAIVLASSIFTLSVPWLTLLLAFFGASTVSMLVWFASRVGNGRHNPLRLVLAGVAITALCNAFTQAILIIDQETLDTMLFWLAGSLTGNDLPHIYAMLLPGTLLIVAACLFASQMNVLSAGDEIATGLGQNIVRVRLIASLLVVGLAGNAVALAGSIGFVGLMVPHIARQLFGSDLRLMLPACALLGALLLLAADIVARVIILPQEVPVGVMTALMGAPFFIVLAQRRVNNVR
ncbi:FecCD family ABC transporter permease [Pantoea agglomerans]|uniref:FecCD family ABC transporter permease n=1 Tax=Enterobacter agglomerans TaxID=549 RepID=UPI0028984F4D|nr:iron ABC transporter permease [Pantoea agglomerans]WNK42324.1 iron ABC transporter permease [Pantoea agglomerans]WNK51281.1 iron ABC transporter permease [Pantoea agglomerans]